MKLVYVAPVCLALGLLGCKSKEPAAETEAQPESTACACGNPDCACPACDGSGGECTCSG